MRAKFTGAGAASAVEGTPVNAVAASGSAEVINYNELIGVAAAKATGTITVVDWEDFGGDAVPAEGSVRIIRPDDIGRKWSSKMTLLTNSGLLGTAPQATITITDYAELAAEGVASNYFSQLTEGSEWTAATDNDTTAESLKSAINTALGYAAATRSGAVITLVRNAPDGNNNWDVTFTEGVGISTATTVQGVTPLEIQQHAAAVAGVQFSVGGSIAATLANIKAYYEGLSAIYTYEISGSDLIATNNQYGAQPSNGNNNFSISAGDGVHATATSLVTGSGDNPAYADIRVHDHAAMAAVGAHATGTIEILDYTLLAGKFFRVTAPNSTQFTVTEGSEFTAETDNDTTADNIKTAFSAQGVDVIVDITRVGAVLTVKCHAKHTGGNSIGISTDAAGGAADLSGATLTGGTNGVIVDIDGVKAVAGDSYITGLSGYGFTFDTTYNVAAGSNNAVTSSLSDSLLSAGGGNYTCTPSANTIRLEYAAYGTIGNAVVITITGVGSDDLESLHGANFINGFAPGLVIELGDGTFTAFAGDFTFPNDATAAQMAAALATAITNDLPTGIASAIATGDTVDIVATGGAEGNSIALTSSKFVNNNGDEIVHISGATLEGGSGALPVEITVGATVLVAGTDFDAEVDNDTTAENIKAAVHALGDVNATRVGAVITVEAAAFGAAGNSIALATSSVDAATVSGANLTGGVDADANGSITIGATTLQQGVDWDAETSNNQTATNIRAAINGAALGVTAGGAGANITLVADTKGAAGNAIALATGDADGLTVSGAFLSGGVDGTVGAQWDIMYDNDYVYVAILANGISGANWRRGDIDDAF